MKTLLFRSMCFGTLVAASITSMGWTQQQGGYSPPRFYGGPTAGAAAPAYPASPLAGGMPAAAGGRFMDVHGNPIVMPAQYTEACEAGGYAGGGYVGGGYPISDGGGGYADFGGVGLGQCGPHYFDVSVETVFLTEEEIFANSGPFGAVGAGANAPRILDPNGQGGEYEPGWQIAARYDIGPASVLEGTYMGLYDIGFGDTVRSVDVAPGGQDFQLSSVFSNFGVPVPLPGVDDGSVYSLNYDAELNSAEISYRRYWVGHNPRFSGTWLMGFRYLNLDESLTFQTQSLVNVVAVATSRRTWGSENDLLGFQFGGDGWICLRQGLRLGGETKVGIYNNHFKGVNAGDFPSGVAGAPADFSVTTRGDQVAFATESSVNLVADILPSVSIRGGYRVLYMNSLVTAGGSVDPTNIASTAIATQGDALFHGFTGGIEYIW
jgi:hypothetical protein